ncbi:DNA recombination protein RmuC [Thioalkalivibrio paradoxus]|uniref:DNA recombination protein RmuC n=1 Tax=Thioalkalivibrio paradoxus ARh 1 TaxID=713585 RepID=W0DND8_9GAMM|nr:DNA recombination protein RmuC [Thioalkalivibrio paradoxus]AHE98395.1 DNA recombination protein RmuC [Thioalkalivibrio paradoxus ARh 1]
MAGELNTLPGLFWAFAAALFVLGIGIGHAWATSRLNARVQVLMAENARLEAERDYAELRREDLHASFDTAREQLGNAFSALANNALRANNTQFLRLAQSVMNQQLLRGQHELSRSETRFEDLVRPIQETLAKTEAELQTMEKTRESAFSALNEQLRRLSSDHGELQKETRALVQALSRPGVRGRWGELTLRRAVELAGMSAHCDFTEQAALTGEQGRQRPDMIVHMPGQRALVVDAKTPLDAYLAAVDASEPEARSAALKRHAQQLRARIVELSGKRYWAGLEHTPEFSVLFLPGDQFLASALEQEPGLLEQALERQILLATPSTLIALLRAVEYGWQQARLTAHALEIRDLGTELTTRLGSFTEHLTRLGRALEQGAEAFNATVGNLERQVMPSARRFEELGIRARKRPEPPERVDTPLRNVDRDASAQSDPPGPGLPDGR